MLQVLYTMLVAGSTEMRLKEQAAGHAAVVATSVVL